MNERRELTDEQISDLRNMHGITSNGRGIKEYTQVLAFARAAIAADRALQGEGCTRSHPHENMSAECEQKTIKARLDFLAAQHSPTVSLQGEQDAPPGWKRTAYGWAQSMESMLDEKEPSNWISVDERLPELGVEVLVYRPQAHETHDPHYTLDKYTGVFQTSPQGARHGFKRWCRPSHWMPLPFAPVSGTAQGATE